MSSKARRGSTDLCTENATLSDLESYTPLLDPSRLHLVKRWSEPWINTYRLAAAFWGFTINGVQDASLGPMLPYLEKHYKVDYITVSLLFLPPFCGYVLSAMLSDMIHMRYGRRSVAMITPLTRIFSFLTFAFHPSYIFLVMVLTVAGFGSGLQDGSYNAWVGTMPQATQLLGCLHGFYGVGALLAPLSITYMVEKLGYEWYSYFYVLVVAEIIELCTAVPAFWAETGQSSTTDSSSIDDARSQNSVKTVLTSSPAAKITWISALFMLGAVGIEVTLGGWITTFMLRVRHASAFVSGMSATGFWIGFTAGRFTLGFVSSRIGERRAVCIYLALITAFLTVFWLVPDIYVSIVSIGFAGFFIGPIFPMAVVAMTVLLPSHLHISGISFAATVGMCGGALLPFGVGAIAQSEGVAMLQPISVGLTMILLLLWLWLPQA